MKKAFNYSVYVFAVIGFVLTCGYFAVKLGLTNEKGIIDNQRNSFIKRDSLPAVELAEKSVKNNTQTVETTPDWAKSEEWKILREAILRDKDPIYKAAALLDVQPRQIVSLLVVEQLRLFSDNRELFKTVFAPLKLLGNQSQFSWGVMGIKQETAVETENHLQDTTSPFYIGKKYEHTLDFKTADRNQERFARMADEHDRFYSYLYAATIVKEVETQWENAGYGIKDRPDILGTLYNIGFIHSKPNADPRSGGAQITIGSTTYSFGYLSSDFYNSQELIDEFPI